MSDIITGLLVGMGIALLIPLITTAININDMQDDVDELLRKVERRERKEHETKDHR